MFTDTFFPLQTRCQLRFQTSLQPKHMELHPPPTLRCMHIYLHVGLN